MQSMRRNWNTNNRGIRSGEEYGGSELRVWKLLILNLFTTLIKEPSTFDTLEKTSNMKQDANSQVVKKVRKHFLNSSKNFLL